MWSKKFSRAEIDRILRPMTNRSGLIDFAIASRTFSGRAANFSATYRDSKVVEVAAPEFRLRAGPNRLKSLLLDLYIDGDAFIFVGSGWGHGAGLCQWGARGRAEAGATHTEILGQYYPHAVATHAYAQQY